MATDITSLSMPTWEACLRSGQLLIHPLTITSSTDSPAALIQRRSIALFKENFVFSTIKRRKASRKLSTESWNSPPISPTTTTTATTSSFHIRSEFPYPHLPDYYDTSPENDHHANHHLGVTMPFPFGRPCSACSGRGRDLGSASSSILMTSSPSQHQATFAAHPGTLVDFSTEQTYPHKRKSSSSSAKYDFHDEKEGRERVALSNDDYHAFLRVIGSSGKRGSSSNISSSYKMAEPSNGQVHWDGFHALPSSSSSIKLFAPAMARSVSDPPKKAKVQAEPRLRTQDNIDYKAAKVAQCAKNDDRKERMKRESVTTDEYAIAARNYPSTPSTPASSSSEQLQWHPESSSAPAEQRKTRTSNNRSSGSSFSSNSMLPMNSRTHLEKEQQHYRHHQRRIRANSCCELTMPMDLSAAYNIFIDEAEKGYFLDDDQTLDSSSSSRNCN